MLHKTTYILNKNYYLLFLNINKNFIVLVTIFLIQSIIYKSVAQTIYSLEKSLSTAKENHPLLKAQKYNIDIVSTDLITARLRPNLILNNQSLFSINSKYFPENTYLFQRYNRQIWWQLTKPIQMPALRNAKINFATKKQLLAQKEFENLQRNICLEVGLKWLDVWIAKKDLEITNIAKNNIDSLVKTNQLRLKNQIITQTDVLRTELLSNQYEIQSLDAQQNYRNAILQLKFVMGTKDSIQVDTESIFDIKINDNLDSLLNNATQERSDVWVAKKNIEVSDANIILQKKLALPTPELGFIFNPQNAVPYFGLFATVQLPFFNRNQGEIKKAYFQKTQAETILKSLETQINTEINYTFKTFVNYKKNVEKYENILKKSQKILDNVRYAYLKGGTTIIDFLEAQRSWTYTQSEYFQLIKQYRESYIKLLFATGKL